MAFYKYLVSLNPCYRRWYSRIWAALLISTASCNSTPKEHLLYADFENMYGWLPTGSIVDEQAYSGRFSARVGGQVSTETAVEFYLGEVDTPHKARLSAQVWVDHKRMRNPLILVQLWRNQTVIYDQRLRLVELIRRYQQWVPVTMLLTLPKDADPTDKLRIVVTVDNVEDKVFVDNLVLDKAS